MFEKFSSQKSDDAFVEAAINSSARQKYIDKLVKVRSWLTISLAFCLFGFMLAVVGDILALAQSARPQSSGNTTQGLVVASVLVGLISVDWQIKFLKALEAGAKPAAPADN